MGDLLSVIFQNLMQLLPFVVIRNYERGVRWCYTFGKGVLVQELSPGFRWRIYLRHETEIIPIAAEVFNLPSQTARCKDRQHVVFSCNITLKTRDAVKRFCNVQDFESSVQDYAMTHLHRMVCKQNAADVNLVELERELRNSLDNKLKEWGAEVLFVGFTDFVETGAIARVFQNEGIIHRHV